MNFLLNEAIAFCEELNKKEIIQRDNVLIAPPTPYLSLLATKYTKLNFISQDVAEFAEGSGPYTGCFSATMLASAGINYSLIGHSERRHLFKESNSSTSKKAANCIKNNVKPIICFGETSEARNNNEHEQYITNQIINSIPNDAPDNSFILAYEPIWAVGTGRTPSHNELEQTYDLINRITASIAKPDAIVYGGSVNSSNVSKLFNHSHIDGVLIGGSALKLAEFEQIVNYWRKN